MPQPSGIATNPVRCFVAIPIEPVEQAAAVQQRLRSRCDRAGWKVSWPKPEGMHLTLKFLGSIAPQRAESVAAALEPLGARAPFAIELAGVGTFPPGGRSRVIWLGVEEGAHEVHAIAEEVESRLEKEGFSRETRPFHAHLTLARVKRAASEATDVIDPVREARAGTSRVSEVVLYRSDRQPAGAVYTPLARIALGGR